MVAGPSEWKNPFWLLGLSDNIAISSFRNAATASVSEKPVKTCQS